MSVLCIGGAHVDVSLHLGSQAMLGTSNPARSVRGVGGVACNVARTLARLDTPVSLISQVGSDPEGDLVLATAAADGVDTAGVGRASAHSTATYTAVLDPEGELVIGVVASAIYESLGDAWSAAALRRAGSAEVVVVDANLPEGVIRKIADGLPESTTLVADPVSRAKAGRLVPIMERIDVLFAGGDEAAAMAGGRRDPRRSAATLRRRGPRTVVVSRGRDGVVVADSSGVSLWDAVRPARVVDVTGAGDAFVAGFVLGILRDAPIPPVRWGLAAASLALEAEGPVPSGLSIEAVAARAVG